MVRNDILTNDLREIGKKIQEQMERFVEHAEPNLVFGAILGSLGFPLYYFVLHDLYPQHYENLSLRILNSIICISWGTYRYLPDQIKRFFPAYFFLSVLYIIPYYFSFMLLKNEFSVVWTMSTLGGMLLMTLLVYDWKYICAMIVTGYGLAWLTVHLTDGKVSYTYFREVYISVYLFSLMGSIFATHKRQTINRVRMAFMRSLSGTIAHEMRNPLNAIVNAIEAIQSILPERPPVSSREEIFMISRGNLDAVNDVIDEASDIVRRGNKIIDSILTAMQGGEVDTRSFRRRKAASTIHSAIDTFAYSAPEEKKLINIDVAEDFEYFGDKDLLVYVLFNLIKNALYYKNKPSFSITIKTESHSSGNFIRVRDTGPGVPIGKRELIFESFYTHGKTGGNGLGLSFCRRVINSFGGYIVCHSREQEWTEFEIMLPLYQSEKVLQVKKDVLKKKQVLVVDDDATQRQLISNLFLDWYCRPDEAPNGNAALKMASFKAYDMILVDIDMPGLNGYETAETLRSGRGLPANLCQHYREVPVIGMQENSRKGHDRAHGRKHVCMARYCSRPLEKKTLEDIFEQFFFTETATRSHTHQADLSGTTILIADDNATNRKFMRVVLEHSGCTVFEAEHGLEAIDKLEQSEIDIVLMDIEMPVMGGIDAVRLIREGSVFHRFRGFRELPIIALTGHTDQDSIQAIMRSGVNAHLSKPVAKKELVATLSFWLHRPGDDSYESADCPDHQVCACAADETPAYVDRGTLEMLTENLGKESLAELFDIFRIDTEKLLGKIEEAARSRENREVAYLAHTLKGSAGTIGALQLSARAEKLCFQLKSDRLADVEANVMELRQVFNRTDREFEEYRTTYLSQSV